MSSSIKLDATKPDSDTKTEKLSLFDQLKNSKDHNSVNKISTAQAIKANQHNNTAKCKDLKGESIALETTAAVASADDQPKPKNIVEETKTNSSSSIIQSSSSSGALVKPEFYPPSVPAVAGSGSGVTATSASAKRVANLFALKSSASRDFNNLPTNLKRSQQQHKQQTHGTKKTAFLTSANAGLGNLLTSTSTTSTSSSLSSSSSSSSSSSLSSFTATSALTTTLSCAATSAHLQHQHHHKKKRCTDRYDSSESSDSLLLAATLLSLVTSIPVAQDESKEAGASGAAEAAGMGDDPKAVTESVSDSSEESDEDEIPPSRIATVQIDGRAYTIDFKEIKCRKQQVLAGFTCVEKDNIPSNGNITEQILPRNTFFLESPEIGPKQRCAWLSNGESGDYFHDWKKDKAKYMTHEDRCLMKIKDD
ncbi:hypothetical protein DOY81_006016, partial [Sarcophaga bullata]